jgi:hypothetical protein
MRLSRVGQHIEDEPCAQQRAFLGVLSSRLFFYTFSTYKPAATYRTKFSTMDTSRKVL